VLENLALRHQLAVLPAHRAAPTPADGRPTVLGPAVPSVERLDGCRLGRPTRDRDPLAADRLQARLDLEEPPARPGRPAVALEVRALIRRMSTANPIWGAPRIHGELQKLGVEISQAAVSKYLVRHRAPPSQTWRTFLDNHLGNLVSVDFFVVPTVLFKVLFVFVVLAHERRRIVHINVTDIPTAQWTAQQLVEAFPWRRPRATSCATAMRSTGLCSRAEPRP
jgi:hypothetical protein